MFVCVLMCTQWCARVFCVHVNPPPHNFSPMLYMNIDFYACVYAHIWMCHVIHKYFYTHTHEPQYKNLNASCHTQRSFSTRTQTHGHMTNRSTNIWRCHFTKISSTHTHGRMTIRSTNIWKCHVTHEYVFPHTHTDTQTHDTPQYKHMNVSCHT